jgi:coenzyme F420-dependent glucose-6-phosphate dehydrogenase
MELGYSISCEERRPDEIVRDARAAEETGLSFALISDHFHPWTDSQGQSPFVWSVIGAIATQTERLRVGTGVTCPLIRIHPAVVAQAAATSAALMHGRFFLGVGTGENLNEHVTGARWPAPDERIDMLDEAIRLMRQLWEGGTQSFRGRHYTVDHARIYTLPDEPIEVAVAAAQPRAAELAATLGDALISTAPDEEVTTAYRDAGGDGPRYGQLTVCWAEDEAEARSTALRLWPNAAAPGRLSQELPLPADFAAVAELVTEDMIAEEIVCGPNPDEYRHRIANYADAGFDHLSIHQVGPDQAGFLRFYERELAGAAD